MAGFYPKYRRRQSHIFIKLFCIASAFVVLINLIALYKYLDMKLNRKRLNTDRIFKREVGLQMRKLLSVNDTTTIAPPSPPTTQDIGDYPADLFSLKQKESGWITLHCLGVLYMFVGLALVCDEFFVPALHVITSILKISDDVAGATFMAAGGSAPELFTSIIGVFFSDTQVGIGTIVGSAVFNVLFVIGMCAMFSKTLLNLTWWPLLRDSIFYIIALVLLIAFFSDGRISWHEALGLFLVYVAYVMFMVKNSCIEIAVKAYISKKTRASSVTPVIDEKNGQDFLSLPTVFSKNAFRNGAIQLVIHTLDPIAETGVDDKFQKIKDHYDTVSSSTTKDAASSLLEEKDLLDGSATPPNQSQTTILHDDTNHVARSVSSVFQQQQQQQQQQQKKSGNDIEMQLTNNHQQAITNSNDTINGTIIHTDLNKAVNALENVEHGDSKLNHDENNHNSTPNSVSSSFIYDGTHHHQHHDEFRTSMEGISTRNSVRFSTRRLSRCSSRASSLCHRGLAPIKKGSPVEDVKDQEDEDCSEDEEEGPLDWSWPDNLIERVYYVIKAPLMFVLFISLPDVRRPRFKKLFPLTFAMSIVWIAIFSYLMLWWASEIGRTAGIDVEVMGLTFIAAGTSIPDLITSVVVARQGLGDMAVSSSIGSNIFDVTIGLPLPWLAYSMSTNFKDVIVKNSGLFCSTILLFMMLIAVVITIGLSKWRMTKLLGASMFFLYVVFITITLLLQLNVLECPFG